MTGNASFSSPITKNSSEQTEDASEWCGRTLKFILDLKRILTDLPMA
jgi:hypothetical protein